MGHSWITDKCTNCKDCTTVCPTNSIFFGMKHYVIDNDTCEDCKLCISVCPEKAILSRAVVVEKPDKNKKEEK